ncbi:uncharacterized protein TNCV_4098501 [Trichonephila clavipes]|nr:uncharacterized protein TNCV_4098501 [Trichonephila clavipes]
MSETEKAQITEIGAARVRVKASLTRLENTFDEVNTRNEISIRLSSLDDLLKEFERLDSTLSLEESEIQEFEERYFYLNAKFNDKLDEFFECSESRIAGVIAGQTRGCVDLVIGLQSSNDCLEMNTFILNKVTSQIPSKFLDVKDLDYLKSIPLSDEEFMSPWIHTASQQITLHGFCDASELAYASVIYAVQLQTDCNTKVTLLVSKSRVAPLKPVSIPSLELNGALLLARLYATCKNILKEYDVHFYTWTDFQVVLSWLSSHPRNWKPYIAKRTYEILDVVPADSWHYVPTKMNPADIV